MPKSNVILNLPGFSIVKVSGVDRVLFELKYIWTLRCAHCNSKHVRKKSSYMREVHHESIGHRRTLLRFKAYKLYCDDCKRYGNQRFPGINKHQRVTERLKREVFYHHTEGISQKDLARRVKHGKATIERWYKAIYETENLELQNQLCPRMLGIDEYFFSCKQGYATTLCDLGKHKVFDIVKGRSESDLRDYLNTLKGKERVQVVCMDLSSTYRSLIKKYFPNALIVADRFHVIRLLQHQCMMTYRELSEQVKSNRGILAVLRTKPERLTAKQQAKREQFLAQNSALDVIYQFQQQLHQLLMHRAMTKKWCRRAVSHFLEMVQALKSSPFKALATLGKTLYQWREEIGRMWRFRKSNGIIEGFHRKMKLIQRRAYGFKNFENYRIRVKVLCG
ncbi:ISL3 family transposase [Legionella gresilensis]|uniref:ISL3 family transposase n=1 Tax=Legionella gresilensis TaxID=91823 RepID=UPI0010416E34|nr:ISL3 family transposase [Legionella gresilensis]